MAATTSGSAKVTLPADNQILITREFNAPKHLVWTAYTTPELVKRWWGGEKGTVTDARIDLRPGGSWRYVMQANGGFDVAFHGEYREVQAPDRLVNTRCSRASRTPRTTPAWSRSPSPSGTGAR